MDTDHLLSTNTNSAVPPYQYGASQPDTGIPNEDVHENANQVQPVPTAPPITIMDRVAGYDNMQFDNCMGDTRLVDEKYCVYWFCRCIPTTSSL